MCVIKILRNFLFEIRELETEDKIRVLFFIMVVVTRSTMWDYWSGLADKQCWAISVSAVQQASTGFIAAHPQCLEICLHQKTGHYTFWNGIQV